MLDVLNYTKNDDGSFTKIITNTLEAADVSQEIQALQDSVANFEAGGLNDEINAAIANYQQQIAILQAD